MTTLKADKKNVNVSARKIPELNFLNEVMVKHQLGNPNLSAILSSLKKMDSKKKGQVFCFFGYNAQESLSSAKTIFKALALKSESEAQCEKDLVQFYSESGPVWILKPKNNKDQNQKSHSGFFAESIYATFREMSGSILNLAKVMSLANLNFYALGDQEQAQLGFLVGLSLAAYQFRSEYEGQNQYSGMPSVQIQFFGKFNKLEEAKKLSRAINLARHLVNLPGNTLNPKTYSEVATSLFAKSKTMKVEIWETHRLQREKLGLLLGVGEGAKHGPCLVRLSYTPPRDSKNNKKLKPVVLVGKGVTFDTGGNDIKPSSGMRLMKKDMGGSAAVLALATWVESMNLKRPYEFYLALAENSVDANSMRPGDILMSRSGLTVEISNTDAEGRLVLADAMTVALEQNPNPHCLIDIATLTGAIKVALGAEIAGLFSNSDELANDIAKSGQAGGELAWRMPLVAKYWAQLSSQVAALQNSAEGGFGGAITAALFLEKFCENQTWAHLDIYSWNDKPTGSLCFSGGSGQGVQMLVNYFKTLEESV